MRKINRKGPLDFILPFLILLSVGVIGILGYQVWQNYEKQGKSDAYFYVVEGKGKVLPFGKAEWDNAYSGTKLLLGDSLKTSKTGRIVIKFYNGTTVRLGDDTAVSLSDLNKTFDSEKIVMNLNNGQLWLQGKRSEDVKEAGYEVRTAHMKIKSQGNIFEVEDQDSEIVRVLDGKVNVDVIVSSDGKERVAETINVGVGQEMVLDEATLKAFEQGNNPSVLKAISDQFKSSPWYVWNNREDTVPSDFSGTTSQQSSGLLTPPAGSGTQISTMESAGTQITGNIPVSYTSEVAGPDDSDFGAPVITAPAENARTIEKGAKVVVSGTVGEKTAKVVVEQVIDGRKDVYVLGKYKAGATDWSYNISEALGNLKSGDNNYSFYAVDDKGNKSESAPLTLTYNKPETVITDALAAPEVETYNGSPSSTVTVDTVKVEGYVKGAEKVVVNDYPLSKFEAGSTKWAYTAKESFGNLNPGLNEYEVYAVAPDGTKSAVTKFTINYKKEETAAVTTESPQPAVTTVAPPKGF